MILWRIVRQGLILFIVLFVMWVVFIIYFNLASLVAPLNNINNITAWLILIVGFTVVGLSGYKVYKYLNNNFEKILQRLAAEERALKKWERTGIPPDDDSTNSASGNSQGSKHCSE